MISMYGSDAACKINALQIKMNSLSALGDISEMPGRQTRRRHRGKKGEDGIKQKQKPVELREK
jgi:hypothetical protein